MAGTYEGGLKAAATNKARYGEKYYENMGREGGRKSRGGGFQNSGLAVEAGRKGGQISKRHKKGIFNPKHEGAYGHDA